MNQVNSQSPCWDSQSGMVLVMLLLLLGLATGLVMQISVNARLALQTAERQAVQARLRAAATDAVWDALLQLAQDADTQTEHTNKPWANPYERVLPGNIVISTKVEDEQRRFDVNNLTASLSRESQRQPLDILCDLLALENYPDPRLQAQAIKDWIDPDDDGLRERDFYQNLTPAVKIANAPMECTRELSAVLALAGASGMPPASLTVLPAEAPRVIPINFNTADTNTIMAVLGAQQRSAAETICRTRDFLPFGSIAQINRILNLADENAWTPFIAVHSSFFSVTARAAQNNQCVEIQALALRSAQGEMNILRWLSR